MSFHFLHAGLTAQIQTQQTVLAAVGDEVSLSCHLLQSRDVLQVTWQKLSPEGEKKHIGSYNKYFGKTVKPEFQGKIKFKDVGLQKSSIVIMDVRWKPGWKIRNHLFILLVKQLLNFKSTECKILESTSNIPTMCTFELETSTKFLNPPNDDKIHPTWAQGPQQLLQPWLYIMTWSLTVVADLICALSSSYCNCATAMLKWKQPQMSKHQQWC